VDPVTLTLYK